MNTPAQERYLFVDLLRGWAVFVMIETHIVNAVLLQPLKDQAPFKALSFVNGLVAPSFLFCAGFAFAISLTRRWTQFMRLERQFWRFIVRMLFILVVAYSLHLPFFSLARMGTIADDRLWVSFFQVDILQVIAVTLIFLLLLATVVRNQVAFQICAGAFALALIFTSPVVRAMDLSALPMWLRPYFSLQFKSQFPLFPWAAFLICGTLLGYRFVDAAEKGRGEGCIRWFGILAAAGIIASLAIEALPFAIYPNLSFWNASPEFFFVRLGCVVLALAGLRYQERRGRTRKSSLIALFGQESLLVYVVHLLIVYGYTYDFSFVRMFGPTLNYLQALGLFAALTVAMYAMAFVWHRLKKWNMTVAHAAEVSILGGIVAAFIMK